METAIGNISRMPVWIRQNLGRDRHYGATATALQSRGLHTVCEEAKCPNRGECWSRGTATFMLLGDTCTRACGFCAVKTGRPVWNDADEPRRVAGAALAMGLDYVVLTSVNRDDLADGGASVFAATLAELRRVRPEIGVEFLTPDFHRCQPEALGCIEAALAALPDGCRRDLVWGHNVETVPRLYRPARKGSDYRRSLDLLADAARLPSVETKSALMLGLGETKTEVLAVLRDLRHAGVDRVSLGQYLRPTRAHLPVMRYVHPDEFKAYEALCRELGFAWVKAGPFVRSSYHAEEIQPNGEPRHHAQTDAA
jgi:lipoyl synthase